MTGSGSQSVRVLAFAGARDVVGSDEVTIELAELAVATAGSSEPSMTAGNVMDAMCQRFPDLQPYRAIIRLAVNGEYVAIDAPVAAGDEVALIPPVAGG